MDPDFEAIHNSIHAEYKQRLTDAEWDAAVQRAHVVDRDKRIAELIELLESATDPGE